MPRQAGDWISNYMLCAKEQESPPIFHMYCGLCCISMAVGRKCFLSRGFYKIFPNLYIILIAGSGLARKSAAIGIAKSMLLEAIPGIDIINQKMSPEQLLDKLAAARIQTNRSECFIIVDELGVFLGSDVRNIPLVQLMTNLYDCGDKMQYETLSRGKKICDNAYAAFLGGTTPVWLAQALPEHSMEGGFTSRILFVFSDGTQQRKFQPVVDFDKWTNLVLDLKSISNLNGEYKLNDVAHAWMKDWYENKFKPNHDIHFDGYWSRKHDHVLKVAMLLSASERDDLVIDLKSVKAALGMVEELEKHLPGVSMKLEESQEGGELQQVLGIIKRRSKEGITYASLLRCLSYKMNAGRVKSVIDSLEQAELISCEICTSGKTTMNLYRIKEF